MAQVNYETVFEAPIEDVFDAVSDIPHLEEMVSGIEKVEMLSYGAAGEGEVGEGTKWRETRIMMKREATEVMWLKDFDRPKGYKVEAESHGSHYLTDYTFTEVDGGTRVRLTWTATPRSFFAKLMTPLFWMMKGTLLKCLAQDLEDIKVALRRKQTAEG
jgi:carbon monoxide dehydrogenase subunit G